MRRLSAMRFSPWQAGMPHGASVTGRGFIGQRRPRGGLGWPSRDTRVTCDVTRVVRPLARGRHRPVVFDIAERRVTRRMPVYDCGRHRWTLCAAFDGMSKGTEGRTAMARNIQSLERAAAMLRLLAGGERRLGLSDIASSL